MNTKAVGFAVATIFVCFCTAFGQEESKSSPATTDEKPAVCPVQEKPVTATESGTYVQYSLITANEGFADDLKGYARLKLGASMKQPGMLSCTLLADLEDKNKFTVVEVWESFEALEKFRETDVYEKVHGPEQLEKMEGWVANFETQEMDAVIHWHQKKSTAANKVGKVSEVGKVSATSPYLLESCALSGRPLDVKGSRTMVEVEGREVGTCCGGCAKFLQKDPTKYLAKVDKNHAKQQRPIYPMTTCVVTGEDLPEEGTVEKMVGNRLFRVCCDGCAEAIEQDTAKYVAMLDKAAAKKQGMTYALENCPCCDKSLAGKTIEKMVGGRLVRLCCESCDTEFKKDKIAVIAKIDKALAKQRKK